MPDEHDHDLLVRIDERVGTLGNELKEIKDVHLRELRENVLGQIDRLTREKINSDTVEQWKKDADTVHTDHEDRLRRVEKWGWTLFGALAVLQVVLRFIL